VRQFRDSELSAPEKKASASCGRCRFATDGEIITFITLITLSKMSSTAPDLVSAFSLLDFEVPNHLKTRSSAVLNTMWLNFCEIMSVPVLMFDYDSWTLNGTQGQNIEAQKLYCGKNYKLVDYGYNTYGRGK
jgi:hypothetical protein